MNSAAKIIGETFDDRARPDSGGSCGDPANGVHALHESLQRAYERRRLEGIDEVTPASACLKPLLFALDWTGMPRHLFEALPHLEPIADINDLRGLLARLHFDTQARSMRLSDLGAGMMPCLIADAEGSNVQVALSLEDDGRLLVYDGALRDFRFLNRETKRCQVYLVTQLDVHEQAETARSYGWINSILGRFKKVFAKLMLQTFVINILALAVPVYTMNVYDKAIGAKSPTTLFYFLSGLLILLGVEMLLRSLRGRTIAFLGARFESVVTISAMQQLLHLPINMTESAPVATQITRLRQFGNIRDLFVGQLGNAILDLPFAIVFLGAIFAIGGSLGYLPLGLLGVFLVLAILTVPFARNHVSRAGDARKASREFLMELTDTYKTISDNGAEHAWIERYKKLCSASLLGQFRAQQFNMMLQTLSQLLVMVTGVLTIALGTLQAIEGELTAGALIAIVALIWRLLSPIQAVFLGLNRIGQTLDTFKQINVFMRFQPERQPGHIPTFERQVDGDISVIGLGFRYNPRSEPAIRGISFDVKAGQIVAISGGSGAGKTTLLKLLAGFYQPQAGVIRVDGLDLRQIDTAQYRHSVGYVTEGLDFFHGTVAQNLKLANPLATPEDMLNALALAGLPEVSAYLPEGLDTRLRTTDWHTLPDGVRQQLSLARAYVKKPGIYLLDDPGGRLDHAGDKRFIEHIKSLAGKATVLLVTHRPSHMNCADRVLVLNQGLIVADAPPEEVVPALLSQAQDAKVS